MGPLWVLLIFNGRVGSPTGRTSHFEKTVAKKYCFVINMDSL